MKRSQKPLQPFQALVKLRTLLLEMERDIGLQELSSVEVDILLAVHAVADESTRIATSESIRNHPLAVDLAQATYHRALRSLLASGYLRKAPGTKAGRYVV